MASREPELNRPRIERLWERKLPVRDLAAWLPLAAASGLYRLGVGARHLYWRMNKRHAGVTTISVGNLTAGGNGKTPFTLFLASRLQGHGLQVAIVKNGNVTLTPVTPGHDFGDQIEIVAGLTGGESVIVSPPDSIVSGQKVQVVQSASAGGTQ